MQTAVNLQNIMNMLLGAPQKADGFGKVNSQQIFDLGMNSTQPITKGNAFDFSALLANGKNSGDYSGNDKVGFIENLMNLLKNHDINDSGLTENELTKLEEIVEQLPLETGVSGFIPVEIPIDQQTNELNPEKFLQIVEKLESFVNNKQAISLPALNQETEQLPNKPDDISVLQITELVDSNGKETKGINKKEGQIVIADLLKLYDLQNLKAGESITVTDKTAGSKMNNEETKLDSLKFTKDEILLNTDNKNISLFTIKANNNGEDVNLKAVLISDGDSKQSQELIKSSESKNVNDLIQLYNSKENKDAHLIVFYPVNNIEKPDQQITNTIIQNPVHSPLIFSDNKLVSAEKEINLSPQNTELKQDQTNDFRVVSNPAGTNSESGTFNSNTNNNKSFDNSFLFNQFTDKGAFDTGADRVVSNQTPQFMEFFNTESRSTGSTELQDNSRQFDSMRGVEFKVEVPKDGEKLSSGGYFRIHLEPRELGKVDVELRVEKDTVIARLQVESHAAKTAVESNLGQLRETLHQQGIKVESFEVHVNNNNDNSNQNLLNQQSAARQNLYNSRQSRKSYQNMNDSENQGDNYSRPTNLNLNGSLNLLA